MCLTRCRDILAEFPDVVYIVLGATHPNELREHGEAYRLSLEILAKKNKIEKNVIFYNQFVDLENLKEFIGAADLYITPYLNEAQITSGTLAYTFGAGKAVVSTPYWHAAELLADDRGVLVPFARCAGHRARSDWRCCATIRAGTPFARMLTASGARWSGATSRRCTCVPSSCRGWKGRRSPGNLWSRRRSIKGRGNYRS